MLDWIKLIPKRVRDASPQEILAIVLPIIGGALIALFTAMAFWLIDKYIV